MSEYTYTRVIPRDLFNEADLLKCYGKLWLALETGSHRALLSDAGLPAATPFDIQQNEADGSLSIVNLSFSINGVKWRLYRPLNCRNPWPLYCVSPDEEICERVFTDQGHLSSEFLRLIGSP